jgi:hypothetical protein
MDRFSMSPKEAKSFGFIFNGEIDDQVDSFTGRPDCGSHDRRSGYGAREQCSLAARDKGRLCEHHANQSL